MGDSFHKTQLMLRLRPKQPLNRIEAWVCLAVNVIACPGLGTWYARRWTGYPQLILMGSAFGMFLGILGWMMRKVYDQPDVSPFTPEVILWWKVFATLFGAAWVWSLLSSIWIISRTLPMKRVSRK